MSIQPFLQQCELLALHRDSYFVTNFSSSCHVSIVWIVWYMCKIFWQGVLFMLITAALHWLPTELKALNISITVTPKRSFFNCGFFSLPVICKHWGKVLAMISFANCVRLQQVQAARHFILMAYVGRCVRAWKRECGIGLFFSSKSVWWETFHTLPYLPVVSKRKNTQCLQRSSIKKWYWHRDVCLEVNDSEAYWLTCQEQTAICMVWIIKRRHRRIQTAADS